MRRRPLGLLGMLGLVALIEGAIGRYEPGSFTTNIAASWRQAGRAASRQAAKAEVVCFGDSMVMYGVSPRVVEAVAGRSAYNLAPLGGQPASSYFLLSRVLRAGGRPRALLLNATPHALVSPPRSFLRHWEEMASPREALDLACATRDASLFAELMAGRLLASFRARHEIRSNLHAALGGASYSGMIDATITPMRHNWWANWGGQLLAKNPTYRGASNPGDRNLNPSTFRPDPAASLYLRRFLALAEGRGIPVYWLLTPISPASQSAREGTGLEALYAGIVRRLLDRYPNVVVLDGRHAGYDATVFADSVHLDREGASAFSADVAAVLKDGVPAGVRWVALPQFRPRRDGPTLLDVDQSRVVLTSRSGRLR